MNASHKSSLPLGFRVFLWTIAAIFLANIAVLELYWQRLQPGTQITIILVALVVGLLHMLTTSLRYDRRAGDGFEEHF